MRRLKLIVATCIYRYHKKKNVDQIIQDMHLKKNESVYKPLLDIALESFNLGYKKALEDNGLEDQIKATKEIDNVVQMIKKDDKIN